MVAIGNYHKFNHNERLDKTLVATCEKVLVVTNPYDSL